MQMLFHLSDELVARFKAKVPARQRSAFVERLLEDALPKEDKAAWLARVADEFERELDNNPQLADEMAEWDVTVGDGLEDLPEWPEPEGRR